MRSLAESQHVDHDDIGLMAAAFISPLSRSNEGV